MSGHAGMLLHESDAHIERINGTYDKALFVRLEDGHALTNMIERKRAGSTIRHKDDRKMLLQEEQKRIAFRVPSFGRLR